MSIRSIGQIRSSLIRHAALVWDSLSCLLWPPQCRLCQSAINDGGTFLCTTCWKELSQSIGGYYCSRCGRSVSPYGRLAEGCGHCFEEKIITDGILRVGTYESTLRNLILQLKFREMTEFEDLLGRMLQAVFETRSWSEPVDFLVPVPLHWRRRLERGFNQSYLLARSLSRFGIPINRDLVRIRYTRRQWNLTPPQRRRNVKGAFAVRKDHLFSGKTLCLIDDITTSGATLSECAQTLKQAGAKKVYVVVLAVAEQIW